jgi:predicted MFS family arabinose efflux permease
MSTGLGVSEARIARLVSLWATVVVLATLIRVTRSRDGRLVIMIGMLVLAASSGVTAVAPTYGP